LFNGSDQTINQVAFGDGNLDVCDLYVTFRRSLDPSLFWFERYWTNNQFVAVAVPNYAFNTNAPHALLSKTKNSGGSPKVAGSAPNYLNSSVTFTAGDAVVAAGNTIQIPITANVFGSYPLRVLGLNVTVHPLDGSPDLTQQVAFTPTATLGTPNISSSKNLANFTAAWLNSAIAGLSNSVIIGTLTVTLPANATSGSAYAVHFDKVSGSPNGLASFPEQAFTGLSPPLGAPTRLTAMASRTRGVCAGSAPSITCSRSPMPVRRAMASVTGRNSWPAWIPTPRITSPA
jgi:hypothetical protein